MFLTKCYYLRWISASTIELLLESSVRLPLPKSYNSAFQYLLTRYALHDYRSHLQGLYNIMIARKHLIRSTAQLSRTIKASSSISPSHLRQIPSIRLAAPATLPFGIRSYAQGPPREGGSGNGPPFPPGGGGGFNGMRFPGGMMQSAEPRKGETLNQYRSAVPSTHPFPASLALANVAW